MQCPYCGNDVASGVGRCPSCGASIPVNSQPSYAPTGSSQPVPAQQFAGMGNAKSKTTYVLLGVLLGSLGIHNFYAGYKGKAIAQLLITILSCGYAAIISWIWAIVEICTVTKDAKGIPLV